jgi:hypothetical protein
MLMMLAILTYGRLTIFLDFKGLQAEYRHTITMQPHKWNTIQEDELYFNLNKDQPKKANESSKTKTSSPKESFSSMIPFDLFIKQDERNKEKNSVKFKELKELLVKLMNNIYGPYPTFKELLKKRPDLFEQLLDKISEISSREIYKGMLKQKEKIASIDLEDSELQEVLYKMLNGAPPIMSEEEAKFISHIGYPSLANFIAINKKKLSVYLASKEILMALYDDEKFVNEIIETREDLYRKKDKEALNEAQASEKFKAFVQGHSLFSHEDLILDFSVTGTNPRLYR